MIFNFSFSCYFIIFWFISNMFGRVISWIKVNYKVEIFLQNLLFLSFFSFFTFLVLFMLLNVSSHIVFSFQILFFHLYFILAYIYKSVSRICINLPFVFSKRLLILVFGPQYCAIFKTKAYFIWYSNFICVN